MSMILTEEETILQENAQNFIAEFSPISAFRKLRDEGNTDGFSRQFWSEMVNMGWAGVTIPEEFGGLDFGFKGLGIVMEELGRNLSVSPMLSTIVLGASTLLLGGSEKQRREYLPQIAEGKILFCLAVDECAHHDPTNITMTAEKKGGQYILNGKKSFVIDGHIADKIIVVTRTAGSAGSLDGLSLFLIDAKAKGVTVNKLAMVDHRYCAEIQFDNVAVQLDALIGKEGKSGPLVDQILDRGRIALAAEMLGAMQQAFDITLTYLNERRQFGQLLAAFQVLQHRAAKMFSDIQLSKSLLLEALSAVDENRADIAEIASVLKATVNDAFHNISNESIQMHGGIGMTDEHDVGFYLKRARVVERTFGTSSFHRARYASINGF